MATLETLQTKRANIDAQIKRIRAKDAHKNRARDTRKKMIIGATVIKLFEKNSSLTREQVLSAIPAKEKALFDDGMAKTLEAVQELRSGGGTVVTRETIWDGLNENN